MNNVFTNPNFVPYGTSPVGSVYGQQPPVPKNTQPLTKEEIAKLQKEVERFSTALTEQDVLKARCTHRVNGDTALVQNGDGSYTCSICGENIVLEDYTPDQVQEIVAKFVNLLDVIKVQFMDLPVDVACEFFQIIPYCKRVPQLYEIAHDNYSRYAGYSSIGVNPVNPSHSYNVWNSFNAITGGGMMNPYQPQPQMQYQMGGQMYQPDPNMQMSPTQAQQYQMVMGNPMYAAPQAAPVQGMAPQNPHQNVDNSNIQQASAQVQPAPQNNNATTTAQVQL